MFELEKKGHFIMVMRIVASVCSFDTYVEEPSLFESTYLWSFEWKFLSCSLTQMCRGGGPVSSCNCLFLVEP